MAWFLGCSISSFPRLYLGPLIFNLSFALLIGNSLAGNPVFSAMVVKLCLLMLPWEVYRFAIYALHVSSQDVTEIIDRSTVSVLPFFGRQMPEASMSCLVGPDVCLSKGVDGV